MKKRTVLAALAAIAAAALVLPASPASAQEGTNLFVVHGLDLGPDGTPVTVCNGTEPLFDFEYGQVEEVPDQEGTLNLSVWPGDDNDCETGAAVIESEEFTPEGAAQALVATFVDADSAEVFGLAAFDLDVACTDDGQATVTVLHATALIGPAYAQLDEVNLPGSPLGFADDAVAQVEAGNYDFGLSETEAPAEGTIEVVLPTATNTVLAVVGDPDAETDEAIEFPVPVGICEDPGPDPDPDGPDPDGPAPDGPAPAPTGPTPVPAAERPLALTG